MKLNEIKRNGLKLAKNEGNKGPRTKIEKQQTWRTYFFLKKVPSYFKTQQIKNKKNNG
jgi:hypothetical protein